MTSVKFVTFEGNETGLPFASYSRNIGSVKEVRLDNVANELNDFARAEMNYQTVGIFKRAYDVSKRIMRALLVESLYFKSNPDRQRSAFALMRQQNDMYSTVDDMLYNTDLIAMIKRHVIRKMGIDPDDTLVVDFWSIVFLNKILATMFVGASGDIKEDSGEEVEWGAYAILTTKLYLDTFTTGWLAVSDRVMRHVELYTLRGSRTDAYAEAIEELLLDGMMSLQINQLSYVDPYDIESLVDMLLG